MEKRKWLILNYSLPTEPSRPRVSVWRKLKKLGAISIQQSMWIMICSDENYQSLQEIIKEVESNDGISFLMESTFCVEEHEMNIIKLFNNIRDEEYREFIGECRKYLLELEKEISIEKFTFAELEEEEQELQKLTSWHKNIESRDLFNSSLRQETYNYLSQINDSFERYSEIVYKCAIM